MKKSVRILLFVLCAVFAGVFVFSGWKLFTMWKGYHDSRQQYDSLTDRYTAAATPAPTVEPVAAPDPAAAASPAPTPQPMELSPIYVDFTQLQSENPDVVGWIYSENTKINYPIVQDHNNDNYYYLHRDIHGDYSGNGIPFMDVKCARDFSSYNTIVYGHHMNDGSMFASISDYRTEGYYAEHPTLYLNTPGQDYRIDVFAGYVTDADSNTYIISFPDTSSFQLYCQDMKAQSDFVSDVVIEPGDRIITLSTCSYEYYDARYVIQGKLVPLGVETGETTVSAVG